MSTPSDSEPLDGTAPSSSSRRRLIVVAGAIVLLAAFVTYLVFRPSDVNVSPSLSPSASTSQASVSPSQSTVPSTSASPSPSSEDGCQAPSGEGFVPNRFVLDNPAADEEVMSLGLDENNAIAAPPKNLPRTASWWNQGPKAGSDKGKVVLSIHTYRTGDALGNEMYTDEGPQLQPGDRITLYGENGEKACYEFVEAVKVWENEYDPDSTVMVDHDGDPMVAIIICWDFKADTENWDSRIFFYFTPVTD
ncbi:MAG: class F sortase [Arachnia sp.]